MALDATIAVITRKRPALLSRCLDRLVSQDFPENRFEIIVVDDGGEEDLSKIVEEKKKKFQNISLFWQAPSGLACGRNLAADKAMGRILAFTDDDCEPEKNWLSQIVRAFNAKDVVGAEGKIIAYGEKMLFSNAPENPKGSRFIGANSAYLTPLVKELRYSEAMNIYKDDSEFAFRAMEKGKIVFAERAVVRHEWRPYPPLRFFDNWFRLKNDWFTLIKHPRKYFRFVGASLFTNLVKSLFVYAALFFLIEPVNPLFLPFLLLFILFLALNFTKLRQKFSSREKILELFVFSAVAGAYYFFYPLFFASGLAQGILMLFKGDEK